MTKLIPSASDPAIAFIVDDEDYPDLVPYRWDSRPGGYAHCWQLMRSMHQVIAERMGIVGMADHINRIKIDNRRQNLRPTNKRLNAANMAKHRDNTSGYKGVQWQDDRWVVYYTDLDGKRSWGGSFDTARDAAIAYDLLVVAQYGEHANPNVPEATTTDTDRVKARMMSAKQRTGASRFYGVSIDGRMPPLVKRWRAQFKHRGHIHRLGYHATEEEAARAVDAELDRASSTRKRNFPKTPSP